MVLFVRLNCSLFRIIQIEQETLEREDAEQVALLALEQQHAAWYSYTGLTELPLDLGHGGPLSAPPEEPHPRLTAALSAVNTARAHTDDVRLSRRSAPVVTLYAKRDRGGGAADRERDGGLVAG